MQFNEIIVTEGIAIMHIIAISPDSYIRLTVETLRKITFVHLVSGLDDDEPALLRKGAIFTEITGYTEWISETTPAISIGWDWMIQPAQEKGGCYQRISEPRSNLMLIDSQHQDFGSAKAAALIEAVIDEMAWQDVTRDYINTRYTY
jgi:hypothetical protein